ncbi:hypothetical protein AB0K23_01295 [Streptomyces sp. NPDC049602]|uniref:hypothetical protein n=1 Tax=Streptomyces sp. NPDC049602 TaxID=3155504 RepID=UPI003421D595
MTDLPHDDYMTAVVDALTTVGLDPADVTLDDSDTRGSYCYLRALMRFTPETTYGMTQEVWPHGLLLIWEWHTGIEADQGEPERGPVWLWAKCLSDGSNREPEPLPVPGDANPVQVAWALAELINHAEPGRQRIGQWTGASALNAACEAWAAEEASDA